MNILFLTPIASKRELWGQYEKGGGAYFPLGLMSVAGFIRQQGHNVRIIDASLLAWAHENLQEHLKNNTYDIVAFGNCYTALAHIVFSTVRTCRKFLPNAKMVVGGIHPTLFPKEVLLACPELDVAVFGEGELTFKEIIDHYEKGIIGLDKIKGIAYRKGETICLNEPRTVIPDLSILPSLPYDLVEVEKYIPPPSNYKRLPTFGFLVQRGCPYRCVYCDSRIHGSKVRHDNIEKIISEMKYLIKNYDMKGILFHDSCLTINRDFSMKLFQRMIDEKFDLTWTCYTRVDRVDPELLTLMKKAGCWSVAFGLESGNDESLKRIHKGVTVEQNVRGIKMVKNAGLQVIGSFILCLPGEDEQMTLNTIRFAKKQKLDTAVFFLPVPFFGTQLYEICKEEGGLVKDIQWEDFKQWMDQKNPLYINPLIGKNRMVELYNYAMKSFYLSPLFLFRSLLRIRSYNDFKKYLKGFFSLIEVFKRYFSK